MLFDDQRATQRDHQQGSEHAAKDGQDKDDRVVEIAAGFDVGQEQETRQRKDHACRNAFAGASGSLDDVVLQDGGFEKSPAERDRQNGDGDGGGDGDPGFQRQINGGSAEQNAEDAAHQQRLEGELFHFRLRADERFEFFIAHDSPVFSRTTRLSHLIRLKIRAEPRTPATNQIKK